MNLRLTVAGHQPITIALDRAAQELRPSLKRTLRHHARLCESRVKRNASGRPGPRVITGDYRRSITTQPIPDGFSVGTNKPQARRLEFGFHGMDSQGSRYMQPPFPHFGPAASATEPELLEAVERIFDDMIGGN